MCVASKLSILLAVVLVAGLQTLIAQAGEVHSDHTPPVKTDTPLKAPGSTQDRHPKGDRCQSCLQFWEARHANNF